MTDYSFKTYELRNQSNYDSIYKKDFPQHDLKQTNHSSQQFLENKYKLRINNYKLGTQENDFQSHYNIQMKKPEINNQNQKKDIKSMRNSNIMLGNDFQQVESEAQSNYQQKEKTLMQTIDKSNLKQHSHNFGDFQTDYKSINNVYFDKKNNYQNNNDKNNTLRDSNVKLGFDKIKMNEQFENNRVLNSDLNNNKTHDAKKCNISLGKCDQNNNNSYSHTQFSNKNTEQQYNNVSKERVLKLRKANFELGNEKGNYQSEANQQFQNNGIQQNEIEKENHIKTNYQLECRVEPSQDPVSSYNKTFNNKEYNYQAKIEFENQLKKDNLLKRQANFILGYDNNSKQSENQLEFGNKLKDCELRQAIKNKLGNTLLGNDEQTKQSYNQFQYQNTHNQHQKHQLDQETIKQMRSNNYSMGFVNDSYKINPQSTVIGSQINNTKPNNNEFLQIQQKLKSDNFQIAEDNQNYYQSVYNSLICKK